MLMLVFLLHCANFAVASSKKKKADLRKKEIQQVLTKFEFDDEAKRQSVLEK